MITYRRFTDKSLIDNRFYYSDAKGIMEDLVGAFDGPFEGSELIGFVSFVKFSDIISVGFIEVLTEYRRQGIAKGLIENMLILTNSTNRTKIDTFAESLEGYQLFYGLMTKRVISDETLIGGWNYASVYGESSFENDSDQQIESVCLHEGL